MRRDIGIQVALLGGVLWASAGFAGETAPTRLAQLMSVDPDIPVVSPQAPSPGEKSEKRHAVRHQASLDAVPVMCWIDSNQKPSLALLCVHGLGLHKGTYAQFGELMARKGVAVYAVDVRGFGSFLEMPGERKCDFPHCLDDVCEALRLVRRTHPGLPVFLLGESMGGAIALRVTADHPELVDGLVSSVPAAERYGQTKSTIKVGVKFLTAPKKEMDISNVVVNQSTDNEALRQEWSKDPLARFNLSPVELMQFQSFMEENERSAGKISKTPVLIVQGAADKLVRHDANEHIIKSIPCSDKQLVFVDQAEHLIFEEGQFNDSVIALVQDWLQKRTSSDSGSAGQQLSEDSAAAGR